MSRNGILLLGLAQAALTLFAGYCLIILLVFGLISFHGAMSEQEYLSGIMIVVICMAFAGLGYVLARKTIRTFKRWRQAP